MQLPLLLTAALLPLLSLGAALLPRTDTTSATLTFDDKLALPAAILPVGNEGGLDFRSFALLKLSSNPIGAARPKSGTNIAATNFRTRITNNIIFFDPFNPVSAIVAPQPLITVAYPGSLYDRFTLESLYIACAASTAVGVVGVLTGCRVRFEAIRPDGSVKGTEVVEYKPMTANPVDVEDMQFVVFNRDFEGVREVKVFLESGLTGVELVDGFVTNISVDDVKVKVMKK
ncbi:hypothetical protein P153DRAFT_427691 [Dothidotthia symphoricarpi CBS 119687]|uniref:Uncharacterized protein n=1 Tax=Dothidotthia symphoricarpi CBS 119687 TaxID=1392245 RepID=A0A6A6ARZ5_9PLEO|nr:uncharacterized protein P153DRAFT_427691 [Dothidotthia symphoricarpi CBS 119687]KAF2133765.1 hypothetical protein P153DRAFT_427691 [Dothidotthia symphoricarpi CBS 119687]